MLIFGADMSSSIHVDNKKNNILVLGRGPMQGQCTQLTLMWQKISFVWAYTIIEQRVIYLLMAQNCINLKQKTLQL